MFFFGEEMPPDAPSIREIAMNFLASPFIKGGIIVLAVLLAWRLVQWLYIEYPHDTPPGAP